MSSMRLVIAAANLSFWVRCSTFSLSSTDPAGMYLLLLCSYFKPNHLILKLYNLPFSCNKQKDPLQLHHLRHPESLKKKKKRNIKQVYLTSLKKTKAITLMKNSNEHFRWISHTGITAYSRWSQSQKEENEHKI